MPAHSILSRGNTDFKKAAKAAVWVGMRDLERGTTKILYGDTVFLPVKGKIARADVQHCL
jgi:hypothetical protein